MANEWKLLKSSTGRQSWVNYSRKIELRITRVAEKLYSVAILRAGIYGPRKSDDPIDIHIETVDTEDERLTTQVKRIMKNIDSYLEKSNA